MDVRNSAAESQNSDQSQPIQKIDADGGSKMDVDAAVAGGAGAIEVELGNGGGGADMVKKKRGRPPRAQAKSPPTKMSKEEDEDVCFICFDGGSLVLCDRRGCPKAYHPACVKRDDAFFRSKAKWNCGWHICSMCQKSAHHMCYTCTYSLCKGCIRKADYVCVRGDKGFCTVCMKTIMLIENGGQGKDEKAQVDFDDKTSWEYLFKVYWVYLKGKLSLTLDELTQAKNPWKGAGTTNSVVPLTCVHNEVNDLKNISPDMSPQNLEASESKRRKIDEQITIPLKESNPKPQKEIVTEKDPGTAESSSVVACKDWATKELLDFVSHMKNGDKSVLSQFDVQELMLEYIKINNLRDPRKKSQILCDARLKILFGKPRVGHFEMLKLLEFHFFIKEELPKNTINNIARQVDPEWNSEHTSTFGKDKKRRNHKKVEERAPPQNKLDEYAAIDVHNMNLVYLRRKYMETLIECREEFQRKVVGSIVRIRISSSGQKHDLYRLVQVVGTSKADAPYKIGDKSADVVLEVLNLDKKETVSIDTISNQDLSEDECRRLRQSIRCGLVKRFTVGEIQDKAVSLQSVRLNDLMEAETLRLNNLRDRASEKGHKKGLREYVEKLQLLKTPEERERRLREIPKVHADPKMNPDYESDDTEEYFNKEHEQTKLKYSGISRKNTISSRKRADFSNNVGSKSWKNEEGSNKALGRINLKKDANKTPSSSRTQSQVDYNGSTITNRSPNTASETASSSYSMKNRPASNNDELDKVWHYRDPSGKVQGPFCMVQLQKWSTTGYFPVDLRIWRDKEDESLLLNDVLKDHLHHRNATDKISTPIEGLTVRTTNLSSTQNSVSHEKLSDSHGCTGQSSVHGWIANGETPSFGRSKESKMTDMASPTPPGNTEDIKHVSSVFGIANADKISTRIEGLTVRTTNLSSTQNSVSHEKLSDSHGCTGQSSEHGWIANGETPSFGRSKESKMTDMASPTPPGNTEDIKRVSSVFDIANADLVDLPSPTPKETHKDEKVQGASEIIVQETRNVGGAQPPETAKEWSGYSPTQEKQGELHSEGDHTSVNMDQVIPSSSSQPGDNNYMPPWQGVRETIEFSTLAEESVSDLLAEVDAMESQNGFPSPTSRRNSFVEDSFNGSFEEFSPTPDQGARSDAFSSNGAEIHLPAPPTTTTTTTSTGGISQGNNNNVFDFIKSSTDLQFKWPEMPQEKDMVHVNNSIKADEGGREATTEVQVDERSETSHREGDSNDHKEGECTKPTTTESKDPSPELVLEVRSYHRGNGTVQSAKVDAIGAPSPPPEPPQSLPPQLSLAIGSERAYTRQGNMNNFGRPAQEITTWVNPHLNMSRVGNVGWDPHQRPYGGERFNNISPGERSYKVEDPGYGRNGKPWVRQPLFGGGGYIGGGYSRPPPKGQRVCKFYESGRCKKGASCNYWHP